MIDEVASVNLYSKDENVSEKVKEIWREYGGQLHEVMAKTPAITSARSRTCKPPVPEDMSLKRFGFVEFEKIGQAM